MKIIFAEPNLESGKVNIVIGGGTALEISPESARSLAYALVHAAGELDDSNMEHANASTEVSKRRSTGMEGMG